MAGLDRAKSSDAVKSLDSVLAEPVEELLLTGPDGRPRGTVLALESAFHGRTMGALALTAKEAYRAPF